MLTPASDPVHKVTIIPRGMALGVTQTLPVEDRYSLTRDQIRAQIKHAMGGRAAEELVLGYLSTGASNDLKQATELAHKMVCQYGMSEAIGPVSLSDDDRDVFLGRDFVSRKDYSEAKAEQVDAEIARILSTLYDEAKQILVENRDLLERISESLLERETLEGAELNLLKEGKTLPPLPPLVTAEKTDPPSEKPETEPEKSFPGDNLPDPEPVAG